YINELPLHARAQWLTTRMGNVTRRSAPQAPWSAVAPATAFTTDQFSKHLRLRELGALYDPHEVASSNVRFCVFAREEGGSWRYRTPRRAAPAPCHFIMVVRNPGLKPGATMSSNAGLRPHRVLLTWS